MTDSQPARGSHCGPCNMCHGSGHEWSHEIQGWGATCALCGGKGIQYFPPAADAFAMMREKFGDMFDGVKLEREEEPVAGGGVDSAMRKVVDAARKMLADCEHTSLGASKCYSYTPDKIELTGLAEALKALDGAP